MWNRDRSSFEKTHFRFTGVGHASTGNFGEGILSHVAQQEKEKEEWNIAFRKSGILALRWKKW